VPLWRTRTIEEQEARFTLRDQGQALTCVDFEEEPGRRSAAHLLHHDEARRIAANVAKLPELAVRHQKLSAAFSDPARGLRQRRAIR
jgi:hypothetical protein